MLASYPSVPRQIAERELRQQIDRVLARHAVEPDVFCVTNSLALVKGVAAVSPQCTLLPRFAVAEELAAGTLCAVAVKEFAADPLAFCVCTLARRSISPAAQVFVDAVFDYCRRYQR